MDESVLVVWVPPETKESSQTARSQTCLDVAWVDVLVGRELVDHLAQDRVRLGLMRRSRLDGSLRRERSLPLLELRLECSDLACG
eukprot:3982454-Pyramimonas_sp.AAC.1